MKRKALDETAQRPPKERRPQDWSAEEKWVALHETHGMSGENLNAWCREKGLFTQHLTGWKTSFCTQAKAGMPSTVEVRALRDENGQLKRELVRKDKALAEAAALLVLQKKFRALWEDEVK
jgi:transposase-like protein